MDKNLHLTVKCRGPAIDFCTGVVTVYSDFLMWAVFSRVILEMGMALFFVKMEKIWQDSDRRKN
jgi:hypothetical protein